MQYIIMFRDDYQTYVYEYQRFKFKADALYEIERLNNERSKEDIQQGMLYKLLIMEK